MGLVEQIIARAKANKQRIVLPEAEEERTLTAADIVLEQEIADLILIGNPAKVAALAEEKGLKNIGKATLIDPENYEKSEEFAQLLCELRLWLLVAICYYLAALLQAIYPSCAKCYNHSVGTLQSLRSCDVSRYHLICGVRLVGVAECRMEVEVIPSAIAVAHLGCDLLSC